MTLSDEPDLDNPYGKRAKRLPAGVEPPLLIRRQRSILADWREIDAFLGQTVSSLLAPAPFTVCLCSDRTIRQYNRRFRQKDEATDVLSFPAGSDGDRENGFWGDILISVETSRRNAIRSGWRLEDEIKALILHGLLHLLGQDHETDHGEMARNEKRWAKRLGLPQTLLGIQSRSVTPGNGRRTGTRTAPPRRRSGAR